MKDTEYSYAVAYIKTLENKMLTSTEINGLVDAKDYESALKILGDKGYDTSLPTDKMLEKELKKAWDCVLEATPKEAPLDILKYKNDFHNLKTVLKAFISNTDWKKLVISPSIVEAEEIYEAVKKADFSGLPEFLRDTAKTAYNIITKDADGQETEIYIDKMTFKMMRKRAEGNKFLEDWVDTNIVFCDILTALRAVGKSREFLKNAMLETDKINISKLIETSVEGRAAVAAFIASIGYPDGAEKAEESVSAFEQWCEDKKIELLKTQKNHFFGFEPIMAFILGKESEIKAVRIVLSGHKNGIPKEIISERLGEFYA